MEKKRRKFTKEFKIAVVHEIECGKNITQAAREYEISPSLAAKWKKEYDEDPKDAFAGNGVTSSESARISELERIIGRLHVENAFLKKVLTKLREDYTLERKRNDSR